MTSQPEAAAETKARPRATSGPLVSDEQWNADRELLDSGLRRVDGFETEIFDHGEGEAVLYVPILAHVEVIYARQLRDFGRDHRVVTYRRPEATTAPATIADRVAELRAPAGRARDRPGPRRRTRRGSHRRLGVRLRGAEPHASRWS